MANLVNQFYYSDGGKPILKSVYDDGTSNLYDASGLFPNQVWDTVPDGSVIDPYAQSLGTGGQSPASGHTNDPVPPAPPPPLFNPPAAPPQVPVAPPLPVGNWGQPPSATTTPSPYNPNPGIGLPTPAPAHTTDPVPPPAPPPSPIAPPTTTTPFTNPFTTRNGPVNEPMLGGTDPTGPQNPGISTLPIDATTGGTTVPDPTTAGAAAAGSSQNPDVIRNRGLYDYASDPQGAMMNALQKQGWSTYNNPYAAQMMQLANGLALSFMGQRANSNASAADVGSSYGDFGDFLQKAISSGNAFSTVASAQGMMPGLIDKIRGFNQGAAGGNQSFIDNANPFVQALSTLFGAGDGQGASRAQSSLYSPFMSSNLQSGYGALTSSAFQRAKSGFLQGGDLEKPAYGGNDWWKYIFGY